MVLWLFFKATDIILLQALMKLLIYIIIEVWIYSFILIYFKFFNYFTFYIFNFFIYKLIYIIVLILKYWDIILMHKRMFYFEILCRLRMDRLLHFWPYIAFPWMLRIFFFLFFVLFYCFKLLSSIYNYIIIF